MCSRIRNILPNEEGIVRPTTEVIVRPTTEVDGQPLLQDTMQSGVLQGTSVESDEVKYKAEGEKSWRDSDFSYFICIQAACRSSEICKISKDQQSSEFTRYCVEAHSLSFTKKVFLAVLDHAFVLNIVSIVRSKSEYSPISSRYAPFGQIEFYDSFDEMYLSS